MTGWDSVPSLLRHCVVAVYHKTTGGGPDGVVRAFKICRDQLAKQGYMYHRGNAQILENIGLTGKGFVRSLDHSREGFEGEAKDRMFQKLFKMIEPRLWEYDGPGGVAPPPNMNSSGSDTQDQEQSALVTDQSQIPEQESEGGLYPKYKPPKR